MKVITRNCPRCNAPLDVDTGQRSLDCKYCGCAIEVVRQGSDRDYRLEERVDTRQTRVVPCPESITIDESGGGLLLSWRWFTPMLIFLVFFCVAWNAFLLVWYGMAVGIGGVAPWPFRLLMFVFPLAHVAVGVGLSYFVAAGLFNTTRVRIDGGTLSVRHGPIPWKQPPSIFVDDIETVYVTQSSKQTDKGKTFGYAVNILDRDGGNTEILKRMTDSDKALCVADRLRGHLNLEPQAVAGEFTG